MRHNDTACAVAVRMRVLFGRTPVRRPACVAETELACDRLSQEELFEILQLAGGAADLKVFSIDNCNTRRVIAAVFQRSKPTHDYGDRIARTNITKDPTHNQKRITERNTRSTRSTRRCLVPLALLVFRPPYFFFRALTQPSLLTWRQRAMARAP